MFNYVTNYEYTGHNAAVLSSVDCESGVVTFKQAIRDMKVPAKKMKGIKAIATLIRFSKTEKEVDPETGKERPKPIYFSVFDAGDVLKRKAS